MGLQAVKTAAEASPATALVVSVVSGVNLDLWLKVGGLAFLALQALYLLWRWRRDYLRDKATEEVQRLIQ